MFKTIAKLTRLFRNLWRRSPAMAVRVLGRHAFIVLRLDRLVRIGGPRGLAKVPTPASEKSKLAPNGDMLRVKQCYTCTLLERAEPCSGHDIADLVAAERIERGCRPYRSKALWDLVAESRKANARGARLGNARLLSVVAADDAPQPHPQD